MKNKRNTGLRAGIYRETQSTRSQTLLELLSALLISSRLPQLVTR